MPMHTIESSQYPDGFPDGTELRIDLLANPRSVLVGKGKNAKRILVYKQRMKTWSGEAAGLFTRKLGYGKYAFKAHGTNEYGEYWDEKGEFNVGVTDKQWQRICGMEPLHHKCIIGSDGSIFTCQYTGCSRKTNSKTDAVLHERQDHQGERLVSDDEGDAPETSPSPSFKRGPGRPRKDATVGA